MFVGKGMIMGSSAEHVLAVVRRQILAGERAPGDKINPLFPALRSRPTAFSGASRKKQIPSNRVPTRPRRNGKPRPSPRWTHR